jgi:hypothetical protein
VAFPRPRRWAARGPGRDPTAANATFRHWSLWPCLGFLLALSVYRSCWLVPMALSTISSPAGGRCGTSRRGAISSCCRRPGAARRDRQHADFVPLSVTIEMVLGFFVALFIAAMPRGRTFAPS